MKMTMRVLVRTMRNTHAHQIVMSFVAFVLLVAVGFVLVEPSITTYADALWYCYAVLTTVGFGDLVATTILGRIMTIILSIYAILVLAIVTATIVNLYSQLNEIHQKDSMVELMDKLERLPELSPEELADISSKISKYRSK